MRRKIIAILLASAMSLFTACSSNKGVEPDVKPTETETTSDDVVGDDAEVHNHTEESSKDGEEKPSDTGQKEESSETAKESSKETDSNIVNDDSSIDKNSQETTSKKVSETVTQETVKETTEQRQTTTRATQKYNKTDSAGSISLDIKPSAKADARAKEIVGTIVSQTMSEYDKVKAIHDYIIKTVDYDYSGIKNNNTDSSVYTAEGALCNRIAVCQGYAEAFELLCAKAGIQAYMVYGEGGNAEDGWQSHAWNVVRIDGEWYQIDCTWDDPLVNGQLISDGSNLTYLYFLLTDAEMYVDHTANTSQSKYLKKCTSSLYQGVAESLSLNKALSSYANSRKVATAAEFTSAVEEFAAGKTFVFAVAVPTSAGVSDGMITEAITNGLTQANVCGSIGISAMFQQICSYIVYEIEITVQ